MDDIRLDALLAEALTEHRSTSPQKKASADSNYRQSFTAPERWVLVAQTRLIHMEENVATLVGLFDEFRHKTVSGCRRLVAATLQKDDLPQKSEEVYGDHWLPGRMLEFKRQPAETAVQVCVDVTLDMGQHLDSQACLLEARLVGGGLQRLVLLEDATFQGVAPRTILSLPKGLDILEGLTHGCKEVVWRQVGEHLHAKSQN